MRQPVAAVAAAVLQAQHPVIKVELLLLLLGIELDVDSAQSDAVPVDAREIGLATDAALVAAVERVIPAVELPDARRIDRRDEIAHVVDDIDDIFIRANAVERRHGIIRQLVGGAAGTSRHTLTTGTVVRQLQPPAAVRETDNAPLFLAPLENRQIPRRPFPDGRRLGPFEVPVQTAECPIEFRFLRILVVVLLQPQQAEVAGVLAGEAGDLHVVPHHIVFGRELVDFALKEFLLVIPAWPPRQNATNVEVFAENVQHHVRGSHAFGRGFVVGTAGSVDMMIAAIPAAVGQLDPAFEAEGFGMFLIAGNGDAFLGDYILRTARVGNFVLSRRQQHVVAAMAINLIVKK